MSIYDCPECGETNGMGRDGFCLNCGYDTGDELPMFDPADLCTTPVPDDHPQIRRPKTIALGAGPGGFEEGARILGGRELLDRLDIIGLDLSPDAVATARAAGFHRVDATDADMTRYHPGYFTGTTGGIFTTPCPPFSSAAGANKATAVEQQALLDCITALGYGCDCEWRTLAERVSNPVAALAVETARWALLMPDLEWFVAEQVPGVEPMWEDIAGELAATGWESFDVVTFDASQVVGLPVRRNRSYLIARKFAPSRISLPMSTVEYVPGQSFAGALGWEPGHRVRTRGQRRATGGNLFDADRVGWCLTEKARSWVRDADGARLSAAEAGWLQGFPLDYPWRGSRSSQFLQAADVVAPPAGAAVLGAVLNEPWLDALQAWEVGRRGVLVPARVDAAHAAGALF